MQPRGRAGEAAAAGAAALRHGRERLAGWAVGRAGWDLDSLGLSLLFWVCYRSPSFFLDSQSNLCC